MKIQNASLNEVLAFKLPSLIRQLQKELRLSKSEAEELFNDTKRFLYLCGSHKILMPSKAIDECWHRFILHTESYTKFCFHFLKQWIHHRPLEKKRKSDKKKFERTRRLFEETYGATSLVNWRRQGTCVPCAGANPQML